MRNESTMIPLFALSEGDIVTEIVFDSCTGTNKECEFLVADIARPVSRCDGDYVVKLVGCVGSGGHVSVHTWKIDFLSEVQRVYAAPGRHLARGLEIVRTLGDMAAYLYAHREEIIEEGLDDMKKWLDKKIAAESGPIPAPTRSPDNVSLGDG